MKIMCGGGGCWSFPYLEQLETSMVGPSQFLPPHRGAGLSQDLERHKQELMPSTPSSLLQGCHGAQGPKTPLVVWFRSWKTNIGRDESEIRRLLNRPTAQRGKEVGTESRMFTSMTESKCFQRIIKGIHLLHFTSFQPISVQYNLIHSMSNSPSALPLPVLNHALSCTTHTQSR